MQDQNRPTWSASAPVIRGESRKSKVGSAFNKDLNQKKYVYHDIDAITYVDI